MRRVCLLAMALIAAAGCGAPSPAAPVPAPTPTVATSFSRFVCGFWNPAPPLINRVLLDVGIPQSEFEPDPAAVALILGAGGKILYRFHGPLIRVEIDVPAVEALYAYQGWRITYAYTVTAPALHVVWVGVTLDHPATASDEAAAVALGGYGLRLSSSFMFGYIEDSAIPALRAVPGVTHVDFEGVPLCVNDVSR